MIRASDAFLVQFETPIETVERAIDILEYGVKDQHLDHELVPSLVVMQMHHDRDWIVIAMEDEAGRCVTSWSRGLLRRPKVLPDHGRRCPGFGRHREN